MSSASPWSLGRRSVRLYSCVDEWRDSLHSIRREACDRTIAKRTGRPFKAAFPCRRPSQRLASDQGCHCRAISGRAEAHRRSDVRHRRSRPLPIDPPPPAGDSQAPDRLASSDGLITCSPSPMVHERLVSQSMSCCTRAWSAILVECTSDGLKPWLLLEEDAEDARRLTCGLVGATSGWGEREW